MTEPVHVTAVEVVGDHRLHLAFEDGAEGEIDGADIAPETLHKWVVRGLKPTPF